MRKLINNISLFLFFLFLNVGIQSNNSTLLSQTNTENLNKSLDRLSSLQRIDVLLDSANKYFSNDIVKCVYFSELAVEKIDGKISDEKKTQVYTLASRSYNFQGNYAKSMEYLFRVLSILEKNSIDNASKIGNCYVNIGETYRAATEYDNAIANIEKSVDIFSKMNNDDGVLGLSHAYERMAAVYFEIGRDKSDSTYIRKSIKYSDKSIEISKKYNLTTRIINNWNIIGACENYFKDYSKALEYFNKALKESSKDTSYYDRSNIINNIASCYFDLKDYNKAIEYARQSYDESKKRGVSIYIREACSVLYKSYLALKQYENAILYLDEYYVKSFELFNNEKNQIMNALEQKRQKEKIDEEIKDQRNELYFIATVIVSVLIFVIVFFVFRQRTLKNINSQLEIKNGIILNQKAELEELNVTKNRFFSILSHDLRNPFNGILGFLNILQNDFDGLNYDEKRQYIGFVNTSANQVFKLLDRLLQLSRLQDGRYQFIIERINVKEIAGQIFQLQKPNAINKRVNLKLNVDDDIFITADKASIDTILRNLVDNAIKFSLAGGDVVISTNSLSDSVEIAVIDTGVGMDNEDVKNIFRIDKKTIAIGTNNEKGTGLGLAVCKEMIDKMKGKIKVQSEIGKGSKFVITFPKA